MYSIFKVFLIAAAAYPLNAILNHIVAPAQASMVVKPYYVPGKTDVLQYEGFRFAREDSESVISATVVRMNSM